MKVHDVSTTDAVPPQTNTSVGNSPLIHFYTSGTTIDSPLKPVSKARVNAKNVSANIVADLIIAFCHEHGDLITNLKLQRLLYFSQGWHLGLHGKPFFPEPLEAWPSGPVQPEVYTRFARFGAGPITPFGNGWEPTKGISNHIRELMEVYGGFSSFDMQRIACSEAPWKEARKGLAEDAPSTNVINLDLLKQFYHGKARQK